MALVGLFVLAFALVSVSAESTLDESKLPEVSAADIFNGIDSTFKRISRSVDIEDRFGLIRGTVGLVRKFVRNSIGLVKAIIRNVLVAIKVWFLGPPKVPTRPPWDIYNYGPTTPPYVPPYNYYGLPA